MGLIPPPFPLIPVDKTMKDLRGMLSLAKTDEGMQDLLDQARIYYQLKKPPEPVEEPLSPVRQAHITLNEKAWSWNILKKTK